MRRDNSNHKITNGNGRAANQQQQQQQPTNKSIIHIEPFRLWTIKILHRLNIITKSELANLLEQYLESLNKIRANISKETERESDEYLVTLEPTKWKEQDHYLVLGLQELRFRASEDDIKRAHRRKALKHHPDKRGEKPADLESDYYSCITRAMDILGDPVKRRSYDSVDPTFDDSIPNQIKPQKLEQDPTLFFRIFGKAFELNARWSVKQNVPQLGTQYSPREHVENFYEFWYNFQSWREFSYLDEEDKEKGENRDERRWLDRQNKAARQQRKKAENQRIRQLVDNAYNCDPRISKFKDEDKKRKMDIKKARQDEIRQRVEREQAERDRIEQEEKQKKVEAEEKEKQKRLGEKKQRDQAKKEVKKVVKGLEEIFRSNEYFASNPKEKIKHIEELDKLTKKLSLNEVKEFKNEMEQKTDYNVRHDLFVQRLNHMNDVENEKQQSLVDNQTTGTTSLSDDKKSKVAPWTEDEIKLLVKSVSMFPAGTKERWDVIAKYMAQHSPNNLQRDAKQVLNKVKQIQEQLTKRRA
uniref:DnaJ subfamily C member 2 n=1 Tax=Aceria tosichella TaxID=561515 RepID=A0A6G1SPR5_9ACAR